MDLLTDHNVSGVIVQGRETVGDYGCDDGNYRCDQWVTKYMVRYGSDGVNWAYVDDSTTNADKVG